MEELRQKAIEDLNKYPAFATANKYVQEAWVLSWMLAYKKGDIDGYTQACDENKAFIKRVENIIKPKGVFERLGNILKPQAA